MPSDAITHLRAAWSPARPDVRVFLDLSECLTQMGEYEEARRRCKEALAFAPWAQLSGRAALAEVFRAEGKDREAQAVIGDHLEAYHFNLGGEFFGYLVALLLERSPSPARIAQAEELAEVAMRRDDKSRGAQLALGAVLAAKKHYGRAIPYLRPALGDEVLRKDARRLLAVCHRGLGQTAQARRYEEPMSQVPPALAPRVSAALGGVPAGREVESYRLFQACWTLLKESPQDATVLDGANRALNSVLKEARPG
jgi:uncharacterized protein HemY